jgi:hypothetical protein
MAKALLAAILLCAVTSYVSAAPTVIQVDMTGEKEPFSNGTLGNGSLGSHATGTVTLDPDNDTISWLLQTTPIQGTSFTGFHIHGPIPVAATTTTNVGVYRGFPTPSGNPGTPMTLSGTIDLAFDADLSNKIDNILGNLNGAYINLHTNAFPGGAVRSQLPEPTTLTLLACGAMGLMMRRRKI